MTIIQNDQTSSMGPYSRTGAYFVKNIFGCGLV